MKKTLGGDRLGAGDKIEVELHHYERSTHDLSHIVRTTMSPGTLVPFLKQIALPGDTFDIDLSADVLTSPTIGPLFGSFKLQLDIFQVPIRLYQAMLHMNLLGIGMNMSNVKLPLIEIEARRPVNNSVQPGNPDNWQINPSSLLKYLGISGLGSSTVLANFVTRRFNAIPYLAYWDIYKCYYANKQEVNGVFIHSSVTPQSLGTTMSAATINQTTGQPTYNVPVGGADVWVRRPLSASGGTHSAAMVINFTSAVVPANIRPDQFFLRFNIGGNATRIPLTQMFQSFTPPVSPQGGTVIFSEVNSYGIHLCLTTDSSYVEFVASTPTTSFDPILTTFPLINIDNMRTSILQAPTANAFVLTRNSPSPYGLILERNLGNHTSSFQSPQEGLAVKTYNSDIFNNWLQTEWISGATGIAEITKISTAGDNAFTIDEFLLSKKIWDMLNRIAASGGTYDDWLDAVYTHERTRSAETPMYMGGLIKNIVFQEVVSTAASGEESLGTLAGRGKLGSVHKGGKVIIKVDEPSYIMGIVSITPNIDYTQGNDWDNDLVTMNDLHKPALDQIGFQDLITDRMAWFDTMVNAVNVSTYKSAGKQPAWINYMTSFNKALGNFAIESDQMFMVLARKYQAGWLANNQMVINDLTTYIDPTKFNQIFADTRLDAMNFWVQIGMDITARRKMSARVMPNL